MNEENLTVLRVSKDIGQPGNNRKTERGKGRERKRREKGKGKSKERNKEEEEGREGGLEKKGWQIFQPLWDPVSSSENSDPSSIYLLSL